MRSSEWWQRPVARNVAGLLLLLAVYYVPDRHSIEGRTGLGKVVPYLFIITLYIWIVIHNRVLFERLYLGGRRREYFLWTLSFMIFGSVNMHLIITYGFGDADTISRVLTFWIFTVTGLGIYVLFRYRHRFLEKPDFSVKQSPEMLTATTFDFTAEGVSHQTLFSKIIYVESLENYIRLITTDKKFLIRLSLKEAEQKLPSGLFLRISRSQIINSSFIESFDQEAINMKGQSFKIGKVYKKFVEQRLSR